MEGFYPLGVLIVLLLLLGFSVVGTVRRMKNNQIRTGDIFRRDNRGRVK
jgi:hypothetical protein